MDNDIYKINLGGFPPITKINITAKKKREFDKEEMIIIACDGLWDVYTNDEAIGIVRQILIEGETDCGLIAEELIDMALEKGSTDNISAIVITFPNAIIGTGGGVKERREKRAEQERLDLEKEKAKQAEQERLVKARIEEKNK